MFPRKGKARLQEICPLKGHTDGKNKIVISGMEVGGGELHARTQGQGDPVMNGEPPDHHSRSQEDLFVAVLRASVEEGGVHFRLRPEMFAQVILKRGVEENRATDLFRIVDRQRGAYRALEAELSVTFADGDGRSDSGTGTAVFISAGGDAASEKSGEDVI